MDINLLGRSGIECVKALTLEIPDLKILMLTNDSDDQRIFDSLHRLVANHFSGALNFPAGLFILQASAPPSNLSVAIGPLKPSFAIV